MWWLNEIENTKQVSGHQSNIVTKNQQSQFRYVFIRKMGYNIDTGGDEHHSFNDYYVVVRSNSDTATPNTVR